MTDVIYLAPLCQKHERMWCEHDAPVDCECIDGPHPWIKYIAALRQPTQSDIEQEIQRRIKETQEQETFSSVRSRMKFRAKGQALSDLLGWIRKEQSK